MAKVAKIEQEKATVANDGLPSGVKIVGGKEEMALDAASIRLVLQGWDVKKKIDALKDDLDGINSKLIEAHGTGSSLVVTGVCRASLSEREVVKISDADKLRAVLGGRFDDLVRTEVIYKPEARLIEMAADGDEALSPSLRACLAVGKSSSVTWRAEK